MNTLHTAPQASRTIRLAAAACAASITLVLFNAVASMGTAAPQHPELAAKPLPMLVASR